MKQLYCSNKELYSRVFLKKKTVRILGVAPLAKWSKALSKLSKIPSSNPEKRIKLMCHMIPGHLTDYDNLHGVELFLVESKSHIEEASLDYN